MGGTSGSGVTRGGQWGRHFENFIPLQGFIQRGGGPVIPPPRTIYRITILNMLALCDITTNGGLYDTIVLNHVITIAEIKIQMPVIIICYTITEFADFLFKNSKTSSS